MPQPWSNLSAKFQDVIDLLTAQNDKLDALQQSLDYGLLTQADPPAPRIPYLLQVRIMLEEVKAALIGTGTDPTDIRAAIWGLAGPAPGTTLTDLYTLLARALITETTPEIPYLLQLRGALGMPPATNAESIQQILEDYKDTFGDRGAGMTLYNMLDSMYINTAGLLQDADAINAAIGGVPHNSLEIASVRGLLNALRQCACEGNTGPPLTGDDGICASPYRSSGMHLFPWEFSPLGGTSVMIADFPDPPPSGLEFSGVEGNRSELNADDWSSWRVWVESEATQFAMDYGLARYPTNQWVEMSGSGTKAFSVEARYALQATICPIPPPSEYSVWLGGFWTGSPLGTTETFHGVIYACDENDNCEIIWQGPSSLTMTSEDGKNEHILIPLPTCHHIHYELYTTDHSLNFDILQGEEVIYHVPMFDPISGDYVLE